MSTFQQAVIALLIFIALMLSLFVWWVLYRLRDVEGLVKAHIELHEKGERTYDQR